MKRSRGLLAFIALIILIATLLSSCASFAPYIGENGNWWIGDEDTGVSAKGETGDAGKDGKDGLNGKDGEDGKDGLNGKDGKDGKDGATITEIRKTSTTELQDVYTVYLSNGETTTFTVTNGKNGENGTNGKDGATITEIKLAASQDNIDVYTVYMSNGATEHFTVTNGKDGEDGKDGETVTISSIEKTSTIGTIDTYTITLSDGSESTFEVVNGVDGETPYIGENGNWWIDGEDTGVFAGYPDDRIVSDGLVFVNMTVAGKAGMVVSSYNGTDTDVVIPNHVGNVPVIGILKDAFCNDTSITSVSLSRNTVYLAAYAFEGCSKLASVDFNNCNLTEIPSYAFRNTRISSLVLPESVTKLGSYCFNGAYFSDFDYSNITYFASYSLSGYIGDYVYLTEDVEYVGDYAFSSTFVYIEHEAIPEAWGNNIAGTNDYNEVVSVGCKKNADYIYSVSGTSATVYKYIGAEKRITVPTSIDGVAVKKIGYGFNSIAYNKLYYYEDYFESIYDDEYLILSDMAAKLQILEEVVIPNGVAEIEFGTFRSLGTMIFIPASVSRMWYGVGYIDDDLATSFLAFESTLYPTFKDGWLDNSDSITESEWISETGNYARVATGISKANVVYDESNKAYLLKDYYGYSVLAVMDLTSSEITIPASYGEFAIHTIRPDAVSGLYQLRVVRIGDGIATIRAKAFDNLSLNYVLIPDSVKVINAYGFDSVCSKFMLESASKPDEWDSYWAGSSTSSCKITYSVDTDSIKIYNDFVYEISGDSVELVKYIGTSRYIYIPREIDGKTVTAIKTDFATSYSYMYVYIPETVSVIESKAFIVTGTSSYSYFYCEGLAWSDGWNDQMYYNSYYDSYTRKYMYYDQTLSY